MIDTIRTVANTRQYAAECIATVLKDAEGKTEKELSETLNTELLNDKNLLESGWYNPPPMGISVLAETEDNMHRLRFDSLRKEEFWPGDTLIQKDSLIFLYCSSVDKRTALFGDIGVTVYAGDNAKIQNHLKKALSVLHQIADGIEVGMEFREICEGVQKIFKDSNVNNDRAVLLTTGRDEFNLGHTVPFSYEKPTDEEQAVIDTGNFEGIRDLISHKRVYVGPEERFKIPETCAFTIEARLEDNDDPSMPNNFFHLIVTFDEGQKKIHDNYEPIKQAWGATNL